MVGVRDTGIGLSAAQVEGLFQPFGQVHPETSPDQAGSGLGLYISKGIVEAHGGRIWCESAGPGKGSAFFLALPAKAGSGA
jgi:signal transduction histidine kinase